MVRTCQEWAWATVFVIAALVYGLGVGDPAVPRWTVIYLIAVVAALSLAWHAETFQLRRVEALVLAFVAWIALSLAWSPDPYHGTGQLIQVAAMVSILLFVGRARRETLLRVVPVAASLAIAGALLLYAVFPEHFGGFGNENWIAEFLIIVLPFACLVACRPTLDGWALVVASAVVVAALVYLMFFNGSALPTVALVGLVAFAIGALAWRRRWWTAGIITLIVLNVALWSGYLTSEETLSSFWVRIEIGLGVLSMIRDAPWFGHGMGSFNYIYPLHSEAFLDVFPGAVTFMGLATMDAGSAHNEILQVWSEYGFVGLALSGAAAWFLVVHYAGKRRDGLDVAAGLALVVASMLSLVEFPIHNPQSGLAIIVALAIVIQGDRIVRRRSVALVPATVLSVALATTGVRAYAAGIHYSQTAALMGDHPAMALRENLDAYRDWPFKRSYRRQLTLSVGAVVRGHEGEVILTPEAADAAHKITSTAAPHNPDVLLSRAGLLLNMNRWEERADEMAGLIEELQSHASQRASTWLLTAHLAARTGDAVGLLDAVARGLEAPILSDKVERQLRYLASRVRRGTGSG